MPICEVWRCENKFMFNHCTLGGTGVSYDTKPSLGTQCQHLGKTPKDCKSFIKHVMLCIVMSQQKSVSVQTEAEAPGK